MNRDPELFGGNTVHFDPTRYLDAHGELSRGVSDLRRTGTSSTVLGAVIVLGAMRPTTRFSSTLRYYYGL